jgi:hypothetical protein
MTKPTVTNDTRPPVAPKEGQASPTLSVEQIEELRLKAFKTNDEEDIAAYFQATHKWFSDRHYRESALRTELEAFIKLADAACDYADQHCRAFPIATAPKEKWIEVWCDQNKVWLAVYTFPDYVLQDTVTHWKFAPPPPSNPPLPAVFTQLGQALEKIKGAG